MELDRKESQVFGQYLYAEIDRIKKHLDEKPERLKYLESAKNKWEEQQNKAVSITGEEFVTLPANSCSINLTQEEINTIRKTWKNDTLEANSIRQKLARESYKDWLILIWDNGYHFAGFSGSGGDTREYLNSLEEDAQKKDPGRSSLLRAETSCNDPDSCNDILATNYDSDQYIAVPIPKEAKYVLLKEQYSDRRSLKLTFLFFDEEKNKKEAKNEISKIWAETCEGSLNSPKPIRIMKTDDGCMYANEYIPGSNISIIGFPISMLANEFSLNMCDLQMSTIDRIDEAVSGIEETFAATMKGEDKSLLFQDHLNTLKEMMEVYLIPEVLEH